MLRDVSLSGDFLWDLKSAFLGGGGDTPSSALVPPCTFAKIIIMIIFKITRKIAFCFGLSSSNAIVNYFATSPTSMVIFTTLLNIFNQGLQTLSKSCLGI